MSIQLQFHLVQSVLHTDWQQGDCLKVCSFFLLHSHGRDYSVVSSLGWGRRVERLCSNPCAKNAICLTNHQSLADYKPENGLCSVVFCTSERRQSNTYEQGDKRQCLCHLARGELNKLGVLCEQTGRKVRCISCSYHQDDYGCSCNVRRCYGVRAVLRNYPIEKRLQYCFLPGETTEDLME